jgi:hypothetical protein
MGELAYFVQFRSTDTHPPMQTHLLMRNLFGSQHIASLLLFLFSFFGSPSAMAIEEPRYTVLHKAGAFEVRQYAPMLIAETLVDGDMDEASNKGFRRIADYIFGNNQSSALGGPGASSKIAMTAPVTVEPQSEKIAMTAPVSVSAAGQDISMMTTSNKWRVHFVMPSQYNLTSIPKPKNSEVSLKEVPGKIFAVHSYTGLNNFSKVQTKTDELSAWVQEKKLKSLGNPQLLRYDPPWTLPMFRRNEIMLEISNWPQPSGNE